MANIAMGIYRLNDFSSDRLLLELVSFESMSKIALVEDDSVPSENKAVLAVALFFFRLSLYSVNGKQVPATHRAVFVRSATLVLTSLSGVSEITKRNIIAEAIPFFFILLMKDITKPGLATSEGAEHTFGMLHTIVREFTTMQFVQLIEKTNRRLNLIFCNKFSTSCDPQK